MDHYQQSSTGYQYHKHFPTENISSSSNMININFLPAIILPIDRFLKEKSHQQDHLPSNGMVMEKESSKNMTDVRADNAPINIKNLG